MAAAFARGGGRDRQRTDRALSIARAAGERCAQARARSRFSGRVCRWRGSKGGARRLWAWTRIHYAPRASRRQRARRRGGKRPREHGVKPWLSVIGIGEDGIAGLAPAACALIETAEVLVGGARHLGMVPDHGAERILWERPLDRTIDAIETRRGSRVTVLASGDPMWYGIGATLARRFSAEEITVVPQRSAFSLAAARLGWPLADCATITLHGRPLDALRLHLAPPHRILLP